MVLDFGLLDSGLFNQSAASGEGLNTSKDARIIRELGFQMAASPKDVTEYSTNQAGDANWQTKKTLTFTPPTPNHLVVGIKVNADLKVSLATRQCRMRLNGVFGAQTIFASTNSQTYVNKETMKADIVDHNPAATYSIQVQMVLSDDTSSPIAYMKNIVVTVYFFDGISLTGESALLT